MVITKRQKKIVDYLYDANDFVSCKQLVEVLNVSSRTIRNDISSLKNEVDDIIISSNTKGYCFNFEYKSSDFLIEFDFLVPENRIIYLAKHLVVFGSFEINDMADLIYVSTSTLNADFLKLKKISDEIFSLDLELVREYQSVFLNGDLKYKFDFLYAVIKKYNNLENLEVMNYIFNNFKEIHECVKKELVENELDLKYISSFYLAVLFLISLEFKNNTCYSLNNSDFLKKVDQFINEKYAVFLNEQCVELIDDKIIKVISVIELEKNIIKKEIEDLPIYQTVFNILKDIKYTYGIDFTTDESVVNDMCRHIYIASNRIQNGIIIKNVLKDDLILEYPFLLDIAIYIASKMYEEKNILFNQEEISFLIVYLWDGYNKIKDLNSISKLNVVLLILDSVSIAKHLYKIVNEVIYYQNINILNVWKIEDLNKLKNSLKIDLIITTSSRNFDSNIEHFVISRSFLITDRHNLQNKIKKMLHFMHKNNFNYLWNKYFNDDSLCVLNEFQSSYDAISEISKSLVLKKYIDEEYVESVFNREHLFSTSFKSGLAIPHPIKMNAKRSLIHISTSKKFIWGDYYVIVVIYSCITENDRNEFKDLSDFIAIIANSDNFVNEISKIKEMNLLCKLFENIYVNYKMN